MSMSSVMETTAGGLARPKSFKDHIPSASGEDDGASDEKGAATLDACQQVTGPGSSQYPAPFRTSSQYRGMTGNSAPTGMSSSGKSIN